MLQWEHSAILLTFIKLSFVFKTFVLSFFEWLFYTGFTVSRYLGLGLSVHPGAFFMSSSIEGSGETLHI